MSALSPSALGAIRLDPESDPSWTRPRRQTNPDLIHRPSVLLRQATRRSADVSTIGNNSPSSTLLTSSSDRRPRTSGTSATSSSVTVTPTKRSSTSSHRSSLSASALSNPALAEIPSRKYNALRLSTGSADGNSENNYTNNSRLGGNVPCAAPRDPAATNASATSNNSAAVTTPSLASNYSSSYFSQASPSSENRPSSSSSSSLTKRSPASRRSAGLGTTPTTSPSVTTAQQQYTSFQDRLLRQYSKQATTQPIKADNAQDSPSIDAVLKNKSILKKVGSSVDMASPGRRRRESTPLSPRSAATSSNNVRSPTIDEQSQTDSNSFDDPSADEMKDYSTDDTRSRSDDVFLNIAKSNVQERRESIGKLDRRRKLGLSGISTRSSLAKDQNSPEQSKYQSSPLYPQNASSLFPSNYSTLASAHPLDDSSRLRHPNGTSTGSRSVVSMSRGRYNNELSPELPQNDFKSSIAEARFRYSNISNQSSRTVRQSSASDSAERARLDGEKAKHDGTTESTLSTTAPSTVWDELDDLKSRIRKLELTGKFPPSSAAAMSNVSGERPRTAATTATTLSSSPKQKHVRKTSISAEVMSATTNTNSLQTLLQSALTKAKGSVGSDVFSALEATATDALTLTNMLTSTTTPTLSSNISTVTGSSLPERQAKRKADSLCRGLTELCLALTEEQTLSPTIQQPQQSHEQTRPASQHRQNPPIVDTSDAVSTISTTRFRRSMSHEPERTDQQDSGPRVFSRYEGHRANTINLGSSTRRERLSHDEKASPQTPSLIAPGSRLHRLSGPNRIKREDDSDERGSVFSRTLPSRAMTEVGGRSHSQPHEAPTITAEAPSTTRYSTPHQQTISQSKASPSIPTSITQRRSYATPPSAGSGIPSTSSLKIQPGIRRYGASTINNGLSDRSASESPGQTGSYSSPSSQGLQGTRISAPSSKMATSYTAIQQPRLRNETVGTRRLGLRPRPSTVGTNNDS